MNGLVHSILATTLLLALTLSTPAFAANPPPQINRAGYLSWLRTIDSTISAFSDVMFTWYEEQLRQPLPSQVSTDPDKLYVAVDRALRETIELEEAGDIETANTVGFEAYGILDVPIAVALETKLFTWGKPIGETEGDTWPFDTVFSTRHDSIQEKWGTDNYLSITAQSRGGIVQNLNDDYTLLVRGNSTDGYVLIASFLGPTRNRTTATLAHISIVLLKPLPDGKTEFRQNVRQNGQSYKIFGIDYGRRNFGFNVARFRQGEKALTATMLELKNTGSIKENRP